MVNVKTLDNGIRLITEQIPYLASVSIGIWVRAGARDEEPSVSGVSHFIEHMMFKGTEKRSVKDIAADADRIAGQMNAFTGKEGTCYYIKTLSSNAEKGAELLLDMFVNSRFDAHEMSREKKVIVEEMKMTKDSPEDDAHDNLCDIIFKGNPLANSILGTATSLRGISRSDLTGYLKREYTRDSIVVAVVGNFDEARIEEMFENGLSGLAASKEKKTYREIPYKPGYKVLVKDIEQTSLCLGTRGITLDSDDYYAFSVMNNVLGGSMASRLFQNIREQKGLAYSVYSLSSSFTDMGYFNIYAGISHDRIGECVSGIAEELSALAETHPITADELEMAKEQIKGSYIFAQESVNSRMFALGKNLLLMDRVFTTDEILAGINAVTLDDVMQAAESIADMKNYSAVIATDKRVDLRKIMGNVLK